MLIPRGLAATLAMVVVTATPLEAQELSKYRAFSLGSSLASVAATSGARPEDTRTLHERPASLQELEWRTSSGRPPGAERDPVREIVFSFYNDQLYQVVVKYDPERTEGMTDADFLDALSAQYGPSLAPDAKSPRKAASWFPESTDFTSVGSWESPEEAVTLLRGRYSADVNLVVVSKRLGLSARSATTEAIRLDTAEAPRREKARAARTASDASTAKAKARDANKAAFRP